MNLKMTELPVLNYHKYADWGEKRRFLNVERGDTKKATEV
jgi:hypothetical protein